MLNIEAKVFVYIGRPLNPVTTANLIKKKKNWKYIQSLSLLPKAPAWKASKIPEIEAGNSNIAKPSTQPPLSHRMAPF